MCQDLPAQADDEESVGADMMRVDDERIYLFRPREKTEPHRGIPEEIERFLVMRPNARKQGFEGERLAASRLFDRELREARSGDADKAGEKAGSLFP